MGTAILTFYRNQYHYPHYTDYLASHGSPMECTPVGMGLRNGTLRVKGSMNDFFNCNYLKLDRDDKILYGWIEDVTFLTDSSFTVTYSVDPWRTYKEEVSLGVQYIARAPAAPEPLERKQDRLLGTKKPYNKMETKQYSIGDASKRVLVVQTRTYTGETYSRTPVIPTPYNFYFIEYDVNNWAATAPIERLMELVSGAQPENIVTMYSIPYIDMSTMVERDMPVYTANSNTTVSGFKSLGYNTDPTYLLSISTPITFDFNVNELLEVPHSVQVVVPEAGILNVPDELLTQPNLSLRQDIDLFSGASNYMLQTGAAKLYGNSIRGSSISSIPIVSDPMDTYLSQNQNALATSLIGDVAMIVGGGAMAVGLPGIGAALGGGSAMAGIGNIVKREVDKSEAGNNFSNPPAFLGTALASQFSQKFWVVATRPEVENADIVHENFGYVYDLVAPLVFPPAGFIQTEGCAVANQFYGSAPKWALEEINRLFDGGILVHANPLAT